PRTRPGVRRHAARRGCRADDEALPRAARRRAGDRAVSIRDEWGERFGRRDPKIVCVGLNYKAHAGESGGELPKAPLLFGKFANTLVGDGDAIVLPQNIGHVDAEADLASVIGEIGSIAAYTDAYYV